MGQLESLGRNADVGDAHAGHEQRGDEGDDIGFLLAHQIHGDGP